jgi:hypothetical protein
MHDRRQPLLAAKVVRSSYAPLVRIEGVRGSNPLSSTEFLQVGGTVRAFLADGEAAFQGSSTSICTSSPVSRVTASVSAQTGRPVPATCSTKKPGTSGKGCLLLVSLVPAGSDSRDDQTVARPASSTATPQDHEVRLEY